MTRGQIDVGSVSLSAWHTMQLLNLFADRPEMGVSEMARSLAISKTGVQRLVNALVKFNFLEQDPITRKYRIGVGALHVGSLFLKNRSLENEARQFMREIVRDLGHTCQLAVLHDKAMIITVSIEGPGPIKYSAVGKAVLSTRDEDEVETILADAGMAPRTTKSLKTTVELKEVLRQVRSRGYSVNWEENQVGIGSIAAPIAGIQTASAVGIAFPIAAVRKADIPAYGARVLECGRAISRRLTVLPRPSAA
jgi:IclR family transcriptional regulator, KDG regulon repressor